MTSVQLEEEKKEHLDAPPLQPNTVISVGKPLIMNIHDASSVKPLLERLISKQDLEWKETLGKDFKLKWVSSTFDD